MTPVPFGEALRWWLKLGFISFGGPAGQISVMHEELVERRKWISEARFLHALNYCMVLPGPEAQQLATYIGWLMHGTLGGIAAGVLFVLPSLGILLLLSWIYVTWGEIPLVLGVLAGVKPAVTAIVAHAAWRIGRRTLRNPALIAIAVAAFVGIAVLDVPFPFIVLGAGLAGAVGGRVAPRLFAQVGGHGAVETEEMAPPKHTSPLSIAVVGLALGTGVWLALGGTLREMASFFTGAALVTFGGAYAVLPYVVQGAVEQHHWLTGPQMIDGLALGETTPGPLIMVVAFVGYLGAGPAGAAVATFFTFLPSFLFILIGAPFVEATRGQLRLTAPLTGITAAVVGVIVNLAVFFASHVFWHDGRLDPVSIGIALAAGFALVRWGTIPIIGASALAGLLFRLAGFFGP